MLELTDKAMTIFVFHYVPFWAGWALARYAHHSDRRRPYGLRWHNWVDLMLPPLGWMIYRWASAARRDRRR
jgi:hypothetical protein